MPVAELRHITRTYIQPGQSNGPPVLDNLSLIIEKSHTVAITGPSGSGKTTLLNILGTLDVPDSGQVFLDNRDVLSLDQQAVSALRNRFIGFIFQRHLLLPQLNVLENTLLPTLPVQDQQIKNGARERAMAMLEMVGLAGMTNRFPGTLSVGECQRVAVVRALINLPQLVLADEPTGSLDAANALNLTDMLIQLRSHHSFALVVVTHDPAVAVKMDIRYHLSGGRIIADKAAEPTSSVHSDPS
jgi:ABC-type lipoprotein export system ATPase subunit